MKLFGNFRGTDGKKLFTEEISADYKAGRKIGRITFGKLNLYYRDLGKKYYVPYGYIKKVYTKVEIVQPDDSPAIEYYRIMLNNGEADFANLIYEKKPQVEQVYEEFRQNYHDIKIGL